MRLGREEAQDVTERGTGLRLGGEGWHGLVYKLGWTWHKLIREQRRWSSDIWARCIAF